MNNQSIFTIDSESLKAISDEQHFPYYKKISTPNELGITADGNKIEENVKNLKRYDDILISGTNGPLGNKYFAPTGARCRDTASQRVVPRSIYINNVQDVSAPFVNNISGENYTQYKGLIPSIITDINEINPYKIYQAFTIGSEPRCRLLNMETINKDGIKNSIQQSGYIANIDIQTMNECWFPDKKNPLTQKTCKESFSSTTDSIADMPDDVFMKAYLITLGILGFYIITKLITKKS